MWKLKFWKLEIKFGNWNFEELFKKEIFWKLDWKEIGVSKIHLNVAFLFLKKKNWNVEIFENLNLKIWILEN